MGFHDPIWRSHICSDGLFQPPTKSPESLPWTQVVGKRGVAWILKKADSFTDWTMVNQHETIIWLVVLGIFIFIPTWGNDPFWLIFFKGVETTNQFIDFLCFTFSQHRTNKSEPLKFERHCDIVYSFSHNHESGNGCICKITTDWCFSSIIMGGRVLENRGHHKRLIYIYNIYIYYSSWKPRFFRFHRCFKRSGLVFFLVLPIPSTYHLCNYKIYQSWYLLHFLGCDECNLNTPYLEWVVPPPTHFVTLFHLPGERHFGSQPLCPSGKKTCTTLWCWEDLDVI